MPGRPASDRDRERFPEVAARIGEDPARYLDRPLLEPDREGSDPSFVIVVRIRGIDYLDVIGSWIGVERALERGPRDEVLGWLHQRAESLEAHGERGDRPVGPRRPALPKEVRWTNDRGSSASAKLQQMRTARADGGDEG